MRKSLDIPTLAPHIGRAHEALVEILGEDRTKRFESESGSAFDHTLRVGAMTDFVLAQSDVTREERIAGLRMGTVHDIGKHNLYLDQHSVWEPRRLHEFRELHTRRGADIIESVRPSLEEEDANALWLATREHHSDPSSLPEEARKYSGQLTVVEAGDRWDAYVSGTRAYTQRTGGSKTPNELMEERVINGRPHNIGTIAVFNDVEVDYQTPLLELAETS